jgi:hypothetical protein
MARIQIIKKKKNIQIFLNFANFYRRFIENYSRIAAPLTSILKSSINGGKAGPFEFIEKERAAFELLKACFTRAPMLTHFRPDKLIKVETDISDLAIIKILSPSENGQAINRFQV